MIFGSPGNVWLFTRSAASRNACGDESCLGEPLPKRMRTRLIEGWRPSINNSSSARKTSSGEDARRAPPTIAVFQSCFLPQ
jgi:hypothetical protein